MYEVEFKVEISEAKRETVISRLIANKFVDGGTVGQQDCYIEAKESPFGGFDTKRFRQEGDKYIYTEKVWEKLNDEMVRLEDEREVSKEEFDCGVEKSPDLLTIKKDRHSFDGEYEGVKIHIDMDTVKFDHSAAPRFFLETEILTEDKAKVKELRDFIRIFLKELLEQDEIVEAPGMFSMAFLKL